MRFVGIYTTNQQGDQISTHVEPDHRLLHLQRLFRGQTNLQTTTFFLVWTNGTTYLATQQAYNHYRKTGDTNQLNDQFQQIR